VHQKVLPLSGEGTWCLGPGTEVPPRLMRVVRSTQQIQGGIRWAEMGWDGMTEQDLYEYADLNINCLKNIVYLPTYLSICLSVYLYIYTCICIFFEDASGSSKDACWCVVYA
jgi:hypothetical protein